MDDSIEWLLLTFLASLLLSYWDKGLVAYLFYLLITEIFFFLAFQVPPKKRVKIVFVSLLGYLLGVLLFYSSLSIYQQKKKSKLGEIIANSLEDVKDLPLYPSLPRFQLS